MFLYTVPQKLTFKVSVMSTTLSFLVLNANVGRKSQKPLIKEHVTESKLNLKTLCKAKLKLNLFY